MLLLLLIAVEDHGGAIVVNSFIEDWHDVVTVVSSLDQSNVELID